jgi:hypothetical protein
VSLSQLKDARQPRFLRGKGELLDPLTGQADWLVITQAAGGGPMPVPPVRGASPIPSTATAPAGIPMKDYAGGPFVGIRPGKNGDSLITFMGSSKYEEWKYTVLDYRNDRGARLASAAKMWQ